MYQTPSRFAARLARPAIVALVLLLLGSPGPVAAAALNAPATSADGQPGAEAHPGANAAQLDGSAPSGPDPTVDGQAKPTKEKKKGGPADGGGGAVIQAQSLFTVGVTSAGPAGDGYWTVTDGGLVTPLREAADDPLPAHYGDMQYSALNAPIVGIAGHPNGGGYWFVGRDGAVFAYGSAPYLGGPSASNIVGIAATASGGGYWLVGADGGIFAYGNAPFYGSLGGQGYTDVVGMAATPSGLGYWLVRANGAIYAYGDAAYYGGSPGVTNIAGMARISTGQGYWLLGSSGMIYAYGNATWYGNGSACCGFPFGGIVAKRNLHLGYRLINRNTTDFPGFEPTQAPFGSVDENTYLKVRGWAVDKNTTTTSITVQIVVDGVERYRQATPLYRGDVNAAYSGISGNHGFDWTVPAFLQDAQQHTAVANAIDSTSGVATELGRSTWTAPNAVPEGVVEEASGLRVKGWAKDANQLAPLTVRIYVSDGAGVYPPTPTALVSADQPRGNPVINNGFEWVVPASLRDGVSRSVRVVLLDYPSDVERVISDPLANFAQYDEPFVGADGADWSAQWSTVDSGSNSAVEIDVDPVAGVRGRLLVNGADAKALTRMDAVAPMRNADLTLKYQFENRGARSGLRIALRGSGTWPLDSGYRVDIQSDSSAIKLRRFSGGADVKVDEFVYTKDTLPQRLRLSLEGGLVRVKIWPDGSLEPSVWQIEYLDTSPLLGMGVLQLQHNWTSGSRSVFLDDVSLTRLGGDPLVVAQQVGDELVPIARCVFGHNSFFTGVEPTPGVKDGTWLVSAFNDCAHALDYSAVSGSFGRTGNPNYGQVPLVSCYASPQNDCRLIQSNGAANCIGCQGLWVFESIHIMDLPDPYIFIPGMTQPGITCDFLFPGRLDAVRCIANSSRTL